VPRDTDKPEPANQPEPNPPTLRHPAAGRPHPALRHAAAVPPPALSAGPDAMSLLKAVRRRWLLALSLGILAAGGAFIAIMILMPTKYTAFSTLQISADPKSLMGRQDYRNDFAIAQKTLASRFKGRDILLKALVQDQVRDLGIVRRFPNTLATISWLEEEIKVDTQDSNELMSVSLPGEDAEELCILVNALGNAYLSIVQGKESKERKERVATVQKIADKLRDKLGEKIATRDGLLGGKGNPNSATQNLVGGALMARLGEASRQLATAQFEVEKAKAKLAMHDTMHKTISLDDIPDKALMDMLDGDILLKPKLMQIQNLEKALSRMDILGTPRNDPSRVGVVRNLTKLRMEVDVAREGMKDELLEKFQRKLDAEHKQMHAAFQLELGPLEKHAKDWQKQFDQLVQDTENLGVTTVRVAVLDEEIKGLEKQFAEVDKQLKTFEVEQQSEFRVTLAQEAVWQVKDARKRTVFMGLAPIAACGLVAFGVGWFEFRARRIHSADEVAVGLGMRVVGAVPTSGRRQFVTPLATANADDHNLIESIDAIRTMLLRNASIEPTQVVMVTSAVGGEGKTTLSSNLAVSLARAGRRTLLVDCDLRRPTLHQFFEQTLQPGFSEVVLGEVELPDAVRPTTIDENLWLLPAGQWDREVVQELARDSVGTIFERLKQEFDFVVIDSHPVLPATDSLLIGQHVDAVILSVMHGVSQTPRVHTAHERLATLGIRLFGAVVNGLPSEPYARRRQDRQPTAAAA